MGKASSAKKVARAAGLGGGRAYGSRPPWAYYFAVLLLVLLGVVGVYNGREYLDNKVAGQGNTPPTVGQSPPWFEGFAVDACGRLLPAIKTDKDPYGITTKGDGIIYISPKVKSAAGKNATLGKFASSIGMTVNAGELEVPGGHLYINGDTCEGKPGHVYVMAWSNPSAPAQDGVLQNKKGDSAKTGLEDTCDPDCDSGVLLENDQLLTAAFLPAAPKGQSLSVLQPPASVVSKLTNLIVSGGTTTTTPPPTTATTKPATGTTTKPTTGTTTKPSTATSAPTTAKTGTTVKTGATATTAGHTTTSSAKKATPAAGPTSTAAK